MPLTFYSLLTEYKMITNCFIPEKGTFTKSVNNQFNNLKKINLIFGPNGSGKTTISRCFKERSITAGYDAAEDPNFLYTTLII